MGNQQHSSSAPPSPTQTSISRQNSTSKRIHITTNNPDGFYLTGERLMGTVKIPSSFCQSQWSSQSSRTPTELIYKRSLRNPIIVELVGEAIYSAQVDAAADSDGHVQHRVNICRQRCLVSLHPPKSDADHNLAPSTNRSFRCPTVFFNGTFQLIIPEGLPPSTSTQNSGTPSVNYTLELCFSSARPRYQIPISLSSQGPAVHPLADTMIRQSMMNQHRLCLQASLEKSFYHVDEQINVRVDVLNPQQRSIRLIRVTLFQFYRIHHDQRRLSLDGKEWSFDNSSLLSQNEWQGEVRLQLPGHGLAASFPSSSVGTNQTIDCELDYRILVELHEKKGDDIYLTLSSFYVIHSKKD